MRLVDTHCHIHELVEELTPVHQKWFSDGNERTPELVMDAAHAAGVTKMICIGTSLADSELAVRFANEHENIWTTIGIHPHEASTHLEVTTKTQFKDLLQQSDKRVKIVGIGECGLDYFYDHSPPEAQVEILRFQLELAQEFSLPLSFHVREAFDDFWPIFDEFHAQKPLRGVLHSFTDSQQNMEQAVGRGLYIGVNGIATFAKSEEQRTMYHAIPSESLVLETDAPFLTPAPFRGKICEPKHAANTLMFLAELRGQSPEDLAKDTTKNACALFGLEV